MIDLGNGQALYLENVLIDELSAGHFVLCEGAGPGATSPADSHFQEFSSMEETNTILAGFEVTASNPDSFSSGGNLEDVEIPGLCMWTLNESLMQYSLASGDSAGIEATINQCPIRSFDAMSSGGPLVYGPHPAQNQAGQPLIGLRDGLTGLV
jgi:hypothetical protein